MVEFCYLANWLTFLYIAICLLKKFVPGFEFLREHLDPYGPLLFRLGYTWSTGVLAAAVAVFNNALIFHHVEHMTILAVHMGPPLLCYCLRWYGDEHERDWPNTFHTSCTSADNGCEGSVWELITVPTLAYLILWTLPYFILLFIINDERKFKEQDYVTMYSSYEGLMNKYLFEPYFPSVKGYVGKGILYMLLHAVMSTITFCIAYFTWSNFYLHAAWLILMFSVSVWNGGNFYFKVFGNHEKWMKKLDSSVLRAELEKREVEDNKNK